jgi:hypothetical protein
VATIAVLLDRASFAGTESDESRAELAAVRHALAEYDIGYHLLRAGDDMATALGHRSAAARRSRGLPAARERSRA